MNFLSRENNVFTDIPSLETLFSLKKFPTYVGCVNSEQSNDISLDLTIDICKETGILQLKHLAPLDQVYLFPHNDAIGLTWEKHNKVFLSLIEEYSPKKNI